MKLSIFEKAADFGPDDVITDVAENNFLKNIISSVLWPEVRKSHKISGMKHASFGFFGQKLDRGVQWTILYIVVLTYFTRKDIGIIKFLD